MTPEKATYYRLMLLAGLREEFDWELDETLVTADKYKPLFRYFCFVIKAFSLFMGYQVTYRKQTEVDWYRYESNHWICQKGKPFKR